MAQIVRTVDGTPVPTAEKVELHGNPRAVTNVNENSTFLVVGQRHNLPKGSTVHIAKKQTFIGSSDFWYLLCNSARTITYWVSAKQLRDMINQHELTIIPPAVYPNAFPGKRRKA